MTTRDAGRELDAVVAEKVMGETLTLPRERAMAIVGASYVRVTGPTFKLDVHGVEINVAMPAGDTIAAHVSDDNYNQRYFRHAVEQLTKHGSPLATRVERDIAACRIPPRPYSTDIAAAWTVVEKMRERGYGATASTIRPLGWCFGFGEGPGAFDTEYADAATMPLAICLAALQHIGSLHDGASLTETPADG